ncbi:hypothetical protein DSL92_05815 [Billgrantia gudaonensis]|uniref:Uncharacterized protein n=1 Tax=Billgrantia gudaonensis TaxID=376427 RepID=A0A3S0R4Y8_9GAMM|nr:hypothetical protein DSL92_05815 [Halomonas gudaonensis]
MSNSPILPARRRPGHHSVGRQRRPPPGGDFHLDADGRVHAVGEPRLTFSGINNDRRWWPTGPRHNSSGTTSRRPWTWARGGISPQRLRSWARTPAAG